MIIIVLLTYLLIGSLVGLLAGLFGIGGGLIVISALIYSFKFLGVPIDIATHLAIGTSLATIIFTSLSSAHAHYHKGSINLIVVAWMALGIVLGCILGAFTAKSLQGNTLKILIGCYSIAIAVQLAFNLKPKAFTELPGKMGLSIAGTVIGWASAIFGIGGGALTVPFLVSCGTPIQRAVAISAACGVPIAISGTLSYIYFGWSIPDLPDWTLGYVYLPALLGICSTSVIFSKFGAKLAYRLSADLLRKLFAALLFFVGCSFFIAN